MSAAAREVARTLGDALAGAARAGGAYRAIAAGVAGGLVTIRRLYADTPGDEAYARLSGLAITPGDEVLCADVAGTPVVLGVLQRNVPSGLAYDVPVALPAGSTVAGGAAPFDQSRVMQYLANAGLATLSAAGAPAPTVDGTLSNDDDTAGPWVRFATTATVGTNAGISSAFSLVWPAWEPTLIARLRLGSNIDDVRIWVGLTSATLDGSGNPAGHRAAFRYDSASDAGQWRCSTKDGTNHTAVFGDAPAAIAASQVVTLRIDLRAGHAVFSVNGAPVADITTDLPGSSQPLGAQVRVRNLAAATKFVRLGRVAVLHR